MFAIYNNPQANLLNRLGLHTLAAESHLGSSVVGWRTTYLQAVAAYREAGNSYVAAEKYELAQLQFEQARKIADSLELSGYRPALHVEYGLLLCSLADLCLLQSEFDQALEMAQMAAARFRTIDERAGTAYATSLCGQAHVGLGDDATALQELTRAHEQLDSSHTQWWIENALAYLPFLAGSERISLATKVLARLPGDVLYWPWPGRLRIACQVWALLSPPWPTLRDQQIAKVR